ncbi:MAG: Nif3-like dinuclear metal center hexameric protein [Desulfovibrionaceae bacterium]|nr:Nif3-like dinuclear metal center hexameric protein [Desulfovibrionaceae bacterium]
MQLSNIIDTIEKIAPPSAQASWDASGVQVAAHRSEVNRLAVCLDPTPASVAQALERGADCILSHHPLSLKPALPRHLDAWHEVLRLLLSADVPLYAAHTSLDVNPAGPAGWLAQELGLRRLCVLEAVAAPQEGFALPLGYGLAGDLPAPLALQELTAILSAYTDLRTATLSGPCPARISRLAYCTGSGSSLLKAAQNAGAELFITGDVKYHTALDTEIALLDVGHHSLEEEMMRRMADLLANQLAPLDVFFVASASPMRPVILP